MFLKGGWKEPKIDVEVYTKELLAHITGMEGKMSGRSFGYETVWEEFMDKLLKGRVATSA